MRILVVEDNQKIAHSLKKGLEQERFAVDLSFDGDQGVNLGVSEDYDLIILDLMLPKINGMKVCRILREEEHINTPILMLTAKDQVEDKVKGLNCGADDYLAKPFDFEELLARIKALTRRPKKILANILKTKDLSLNTIDYQVKRGKREIELSKTEFSLLEYLMRHSGQVVSKQQIINHVWDYDADVLPNTVEVYIGYLRKKLDKPNLIKTIRGFGYKLTNGNE